MTANDNAVEAIWCGTMPIGETEIEVAVLSDGKRIIEADSLQRLFRYMNRGGHITQEQSRAIMQFCRGHGLPEKSEVSGAKKQD